MKKFLTIFIIIIYSACTSLTYASTSTDTISKIENNIYGFEYSKDNIKTRVERLEKTIYGKPSSGGDINNRIKKLSGDISADVIGLEIPPTEDTFAENEKISADNTVSYPIVDEIEQKLFNQTYKDRDFHTRIVTIEKKLFGKVYDVDDYSTRMDRIKAEIMPESTDTDRFAHEYRDNRENTISSDDLSGTSQSRFGMPFGQKKYTRPYTNYGDSFTGAASPMQSYSPDLNDELSKMEYETFGTEFSNEDTASRIKRLNSVNKARKSSSKYDSQKFSQRMSTAMEIGAMILMILAMVL